LTDGEPDERRAAALALGELRAPSKDAIPALVVALKDDAWGVRTFAVRALGRIGADDPGVISAVAEALKEEARHGASADGTFLFEAVQVLAIGGERGVSALDNILTGGSLYGRRFAAWGLRFAHDSPAALRACQRAASDPAWQVRSAAIDTLEQITGPTSKTVTIIGTALKDSHPLVRASAAEVLGRCGPAAKSAIPALEEKLRDSDPEVRKAAAEALQRVRQPPKPSTEKPKSNP